MSATEIETNSANASVVYEHRAPYDPFAAAKQKVCMACGKSVAASSTTCPECGTAMALVESADLQVEADDMPTWESELAFEGLATSDGRYLLPGQIGNRELPLSLMLQTVTAEGHDGAEVCGKLTKIWREDRGDLGEGVVCVMGSGEFATDVAGPKAASLVEQEVLRGVSVDISPDKRVLLDAETKEEVSEEEFDFEKYASGGYLLGIGGEIMGATLCAFPAFAEARMRIVPVVDDADEDEGVVAAAGSSKSMYFATTPSAPITIIPRSITAAAAGIAPIAPPKDWFFTPEVDGKLPLTVMDDGRIMGHLATWDQCHHGFLNECVLAKPSRADYSFFHVGALRTEEGDWVEVGRIVVGETSQSGHANVQYSAAEASKHYDKSALVGAFVRAVDGKYGIWLSGVVRSDCPAEKVRDMLANPPSGDWRRENGWLELIAALSVPVPGFPVPRYEYSLVASAENAEVQTLIATGYYEIDKPTYSRAELRRRDMLLSKARELV